MAAFEAEAGRVRTHATHPSTPGIVGGVRAPLPEPFVERELFEPVDECLPGGRVNPDAIGWSRRPLHRCNLNGAPLREKRWDYWCVTTDTHLFSLTFTDLGYVGLANAWFLEYAGGGLVERSTSVPFARGFAHIGMAIETRFDLAELHAIAALLHHAVFAARVDVYPARFLGDDIAGLVPRFGRIGGDTAREVGLCCLLGKIPIARRYRRAANAQLAALSFRYLVALVVDHHRFQVRTHHADGKRILTIGRKGSRQLVEGADVGLGRTVEIEVA